MMKDIDEKNVVVNPPTFDKYEPPSCSGLSAPTPAAAAFY
jgi:hypothetical protein